MPVLPTVDQLPSAVFQPQRGVVSVQTGQVGQALTQAGRELQRTSERVLNHIDDTASLHARAAIVELKRAQNQLAIGEGGYAHLKNGAATTPGVVKDYETRFKDQVTALGANLSPEARQKFDGMAREQGTNFQAGVLTHIMREDLSHRGEVYAAQIGVASETMGLNYNNPDVILRERASIEAIVAGYAQKNGIKDKALLERMLQDARGSGHEAIINGYLTAGQAGQAQEYFEVIRKNGGEITPAKAKSIENMLKPEVAFETGRAIAAELFALEVGGATASEIAAQKLKMTDGKSREVVAAVDKAFGDQINALDQDRKDTGGDILMDFINGKGGSGPGDPRLRAIRAADPTHAVDLVLKMERIAKRRAVGADDVTSMTSMGTYGTMAERIADPDDIVNINDVIDLGGSVTDQHHKELMAMVRSQGDKAAKDKISTAMLNAGIPRSAIGNTEATNAYKGFAASAHHQWKQRNPGKFATEAEKKAIVLSATEEHIDVGSWWGFKTTTTDAFQTGRRTTFPTSYKQKLPDRDDDELAAAHAWVVGVRDTWKVSEDGPMPTDAKILDTWDENN